MTERPLLLREVAAPEVEGGVFLAIDTAIGTSVAVGAAGRVVEAASADPMAHAEVIGELIARALAEAGVTGAEVTRVVAGMGPGPFTGLRVGIAAATAFARGRGLTPLPLLGHEAVALDAYALPGAGHTVTVLQDARRRELFRSRFL
ncbi:tRNA (adenosine(37)-N6)-threonylcarbamoyltransferase complex dimerization subunit type 1 TsaB, partial [Leucobacter sp. M11]|uniref:tRNA (adenosine(37)-N6)-threonylcarbamoyltransferase complex dimerization subunit type 1 TsaB n=1 Tax=Leucobacter sp. M11 TaxID=2993565 RepID=UPI002D7E752B